MPTGAMSMHAAETGNMYYLAFIYPLNPKP